MPIERGDAGQGFRHSDKTIQIPLIEIITVWFVQRRIRHRAQRIAFLPDFSRRVRQAWQQGGDRGKTSKNFSSE